MSKQSVNIVEFLNLYNILYEIKDLFIFHINNYKNSNHFLQDIESNIIDHDNSIIIVNNKKHELFSNNKINNRNILIVDEFPLKIERLIDKINTHLIKEKYNFQSKLNIKNYVLNLNSRIISNKEFKLKLTEREIDIILFLKKKGIPQSIISLQNEVWGYSDTLETHTVETHIYRLRKKIKDKFKDDKFITSHNDGYLI
tara:strand:- start:99 stop:695 length:597 start_codon:yes stop_codon:yes gene_type:complete